MTGHQIVTLGEMKRMLNEDHPQELLDAVKIVHDFLDREMGKELAEFLRNRPFKSFDGETYNFEKL